MAWLARSFWWLLRLGLALACGFLLLLALYVSLGRELAPLLAEYRDEVQQEVQKLTGMPIRIGRLEGAWRGLGPLLVAHDVNIGSGASSIHLDRLSLEPNLLTGLLEQRLEVSLLELQGLRLLLAQTAEGDWQLDGLPAAEPASAPSDPLQQLRALQGVAQLLLLDSQVTVQPYQQKPLTFTYIDLSLRNQGSRQHLAGRLILPDGQPLRFDLRSRLNLQNWRQSSAKLYVNLPQSDWAKWLPASLLPGYTLSQLEAGGELWAVAAEGQVQQLVARVHAPSIALKAAAGDVQALHDLALSAYLERQDEGYALRLDGLALSWNGTRLGPLQLAAKQTGQAAAEEWQLQLDHINLAPVGGLLAALAVLPEAANQWLVGLKPKGQVSNLSLSFKPQNLTPERLQFATNVTAVGVSPYSDVPGLENISGSLSGNFAGGELRLDTEDFVLNLEEIFPQAWHYRRANAALHWQLDEQAFTLSSAYIKLDGEEGKIAGDMRIYLPFAADSESYMDLRVGLREGDAAFTGKYLPRPSASFSADLADWLRTAIRSGKIDEGVFQYQGALSADAPATASTLGLYFKLHDLTLAYQPGWPELNEAQGEVFVGESGVQVAVSQGRILDSQVSELEAQVATAGPRQVAKLELTAQLDSSVSDGLHILQSAPLGTAETFAGWRGEGALPAKLRLDIPLGGSQPPLVVVDFTANNASLQIAEPALALSQINGSFRYHSVNGLSSAKYRLQTFGRAVNGRIVGEAGQGGSNTRVEANGSIALNTLSQWLQLPPQPLPVSGNLPYQLSLLIDAKNPQLSIKSSLQGLAIDLPAPFGKSANDIRNSRVRMDLTGAERSYRLRYADLASVAFAAPPANLKQGRGELVLGGVEAQLPTTPGLRVSGKLAELDVDVWQATLKKYAPTTTSAAGGEFLRSANLTIGRFRGMGLEAEQLQVDLTRQPAAWALSLHSSLLDGLVLLPDQSGVPIDLKLQRLSLPEPATTDAEAVARPDPLAAVAPSSVPAIDVSIADVQLGSESLGSWALKVRPVKGGVVFSELQLNAKGLLITGTAGWDEHKDGARSWFTGRLAGKNLADVLTAWGYAPSATSQRFRMDVHGNWPGSPAWVSLARLSGRLDASMHKGSFVEVDGGSKALRVFGLLNFNAIGRRLRLDFSDLFGKGLAYDKVSGVLQGDAGQFVTEKPVAMTGPSMQFQLDGTLDMAKEQIDAKLHVGVPVSSNIPLAALLVGAPAIAGAFFVADKLFGSKVANLVQVQYKVVGPLDDPVISFVKPY